MDKLEITPDTKVDFLLKDACVRGALRGKTFREVWRMFPMRAVCCMPTGNSAWYYFKGRMADEYNRHGPSQRWRTWQTLQAVVYRVRVYNKSGIKRPVETICRDLTKQLAALTPQRRVGRFWMYLVGNA